MPDGIQLTETPSPDSGVGYIHLQISAEWPEPFAEKVRIASYQIRVEGDGLEPQDQTVSNLAAGATLDRIPAGENRVLKVSAKNSAGEILREGISAPFHLDGGENVSLDLPLHPVPYVLNLRDQDWVSNRRLFFSILTDPKNRLQINDGTIVSADERGVARFYPTLLPAGPHPFVIQDIDAQTKRELNLQLWEGASSGGASFIAAGQVGKNSEPFRFDRLGQPFAASYARVAEQQWRFMP